MTRVLAIETSCDETAMAVVECGEKFKVLSEAVASQIKIHRPYGGVFPALAKREHIKNLPAVYKKIAHDSKKIDLIAVTVGPGLEPALWTGINFANDLGKKLGVKVVGVNHLEGHVYSNWIANEKIKFPAAVLLVSGGHTILLFMKSMKEWEKLGETRDDSAGEAFDKVARMLNLPYPGGPEIEKLAKKGDGDAIQFPRPMIGAKNFDFSFSGLKTAVLYYLKNNPKHRKEDVAASFQKAAVDVLVKKTKKAASELNAKSILLCGGVGCNEALKKALQPDHVPELKYNTDNGAMIGSAACWGKRYSSEKALPNLDL